MEIAVGRGWLSRHSLAPQAVTEGSGPEHDTPAPRWGPRIDRLAAQGTLAAETIDDLISECLSEQTAAGGSFDPPGQRSPAAGPLAAGGLPAFLQKWERYEIVRLLGEGGMGTVYEARDRQLGRLVALKFIRGERSGSAQRFLQEARTQARIEHEHICKVYEVGDFDGRPYIAMALMQGVPLHQAYKPLHLEQRVRVLRDIAAAAHAAHRLGVIHRDLKPGNVLLERREDGSYRPTVMDFGLAHDPEAAEPLTRTGAVMGPPAYMSPEQACGDTQRVDRRSDIYSLGAILYELLASRPPFRGAHTVETLRQVIHDEPTPVRKLVPTVPRDLEVIAHKCLEKDPLRRYQSAQALVRDLQAYLDGEPILARPPSRIRNLLKRVRRHRWPVALAALSLAALAGIGGISARTRIQAARQLALSQQFGEQARAVEEVMQRGYMSPPHAIGRERQLAQKRLDQIDGQMQAAGELGRGPGHYALGFGHLAMQDYKTALSHLQEAQRSGYRSPRLSYALGRTLAELYRIEWERADQLRDATSRKARLAEIDRQFRWPALAELSLYIKSGSDATSEREYVDALLAYCRGDYPQALRGAQKVFSQTPWFHESARLAGDACIAMGKQAVEKEDFAAAQAQFAAAGAAYHEAAAYGRSDPLVYVSQATQGAQELGAWSLGLGRPPGERLAAVRAAAEQALRIDPGRADAKQALLTGYAYLMQYEDAKDELGPELDEAIAFAEQNRTQIPDLPYLLADLYFFKGRDEERQGRDARSTYDKAIKELSGFLQDITQRKNIDRQVLTYVFVTMQGLYERQAHIAMEHGQSPQVPLSLIAQQQPQLRLTLSDSWEMNFLQAKQRLWEGDYEMKRGKSPMASYREALTLMQSVAAANLTKSLLGSLLVYNSMSQYALLTGEYDDDYIINLKKFIDDLENNKTLSDSWWRIKYLPQSLHLAIAELELQRHEDPSADIARAQRDIRLCSENVRFRSGPRELADSYILGARWTLASTTAPAPATVDALFAAAAAAFQRATELEGNRAITYRTGAQLRRWQAEWALRQHRPVGPLVAAGLSLSAHARSIDAADQQTLALEGCLHLLRARAESSCLARQAAAGEAQTRLTEALRANPLLRALYQPSLTEAQRLATPKGCLK